LTAEIQEINSQEKEFWHHATRYASAVDEDESFVTEMAYVMVTLHKTGA